MEEGLTAWTLHPYKAGRGWGGDGSITEVLTYALLVRRGLVNKYVKSISTYLQM